jgi:hypothetical protein
MFVMTFTQICEFKEINEQVFYILHFIAMYNIHVVFRPSVETCGTESSSSNKWC